MMNSSSSFGSPALRRRSWTEVMVTRRWNFLKTSIDTCHNVLSQSEDLDLTLMRFPSILLHGGGVLAFIASLNENARMAEVTISAISYAAQNKLCTLGLHICISNAKSFLLKQISTILPRNGQNVASSKLLGIFFRSTIFLYLVKLIK